MTLPASFRFGFDDISKFPGTLVDPVSCGGDLVSDWLGSICSGFVPTCPPGASPVQDGMFRQWRCAYPLDYAPSSAPVYDEPVEVEVETPVFVAADPPVPLVALPDGTITHMDTIPQINCLWGDTFQDDAGEWHCQSVMCSDDETHVWNWDGTEQCVGNKPDPWSVPCVAPNVRRTNGSCGPYIENTPTSVQLQPTASLPLPNTTTAPGVTGIAAIDGIFAGFVDAKGQIFGMSPMVVIAVAVGGVLLLSSSGGRK